MTGRTAFTLLLLVGVLATIWLIRRTEVTLRRDLSEVGEYRVVLQVTGPRVVAVMKEIRRVTGLGVRDTRDLVEKTPSIVAQGISQRAAERAAERLQALGARAVAVPMEDFGPRADWSGDPG